VDDKWSLATNASGGSINANTGAYVAGTTGGMDTVQVVDSLGNSDTANITVMVATVDDAGIEAGEPDAGVPMKKSVGCGCRAAGTSPTDGLFSVLVLAGLARLGRRRTAKSRTPKRIRPT
jgi:MYXO-CTERM domain-containing protein